MKDLVYIFTKIVPRWFGRQKRLIKRRQGIRSHIHLTAVFHKVGEGPYVKKSRGKYGS